MSRLFKAYFGGVKDSRKDIAKGTGESAKVTVYYTEEAGKKIAHFFE